MYLKAFDVQKFCYVHFHYFIYKMYMSLHISDVLDMISSLHLFSNAERF